jgi:hypothetical protein
MCCIDIGQRLGRLILESHIATYSDRWGTQIAACRLLRQALGMRTAICDALMIDIVASITRQSSISMSRRNHRTDNDKSDYRKKCLDSHESIL